MQLSTNTTTTTIEGVQIIRSSSYQRSIQIIDTIIIIIIIIVCDDSITNNVTGRRNEFTYPCGMDVVVTTITLFDRDDSTIDVSESFVSEKAGVLHEYKF